jgi:hypothetical protein
MEKHYTTFDDCDLPTLIKHCLTSLKETSQNGDINAKNTSVSSPLAISFWHAPSRFLRPSSFCLRLASRERVLWSCKTCTYWIAFCARILVALRLPSCVFSFSQVSIVGIGHEFKTFDGEEVQQYIDLMDKDEIAEAPAADPAMQE